MTVIRIEDIKNESYINELAENETNITRGGILPYVVAFWVGYQIGKEAKTNWFAP